MFVFPLLLWSCFLRFYCTVEHDWKVLSYNQDRCYWQLYKRSNIPFYQLELNLFHQFFFRDMMHFVDSNYMQECIYIYICCFLHFHFKLSSKFRVPTMRIQSQCGWMMTLKSNLHSLGVGLSFHLVSDISFQFILLIHFKVMGFLGFVWLVWNRRFWRIFLNVFYLRLSNL